MGGIRHGRILLEACALNPMRLAPCHPATAVRFPMPPRPGISDSEILPIFYRFGDCHFPKNVL